MKPTTVFHEKDFFTGQTRKVVKHKTKGIQVLDIERLNKLYEETLGKQTYYDLNENDLFGPSAQQQQFGYELQRQWPEIYKCLKELR